MLTIPIYSRPSPKRQRVFDVETDETGKIYRYLTQNLRGSFEVEVEDVNKQIADYIKKIEKKNTTEQPEPK